MGEARRLCQRDGVGEVAADGGGLVRVGADGEDLDAPLPGKLQQVKAGVRLVGVVDKPGGVDLDARAGGGHPLQDRNHLIPHLAFQ